MKKSALLLAILSVTACHNSSSPSSNTAADPVSSTSLSGFAADGYLLNATVCLDTNNDNSCAGELTTTTDTLGNFDLEASQADIDQYPVLVEAIAGVTEDSDNPGQPIQQSFTLSAPAGLTDAVGQAPVTPLTTIVKLEADQNPGQALSTVLENSSIRSICNDPIYSGSTLDCVTKDYLQDAADDDSPLQAAAQRVHLNARVLTQVIANHQQATDGDANNESTEGSAAANAALLDQTQQAQAKTEQALQANNGDASMVDESLIADDSLAIDAEGLNALIAFKQAPRESVRTFAVYRPTIYSFRLENDSILQDAIVNGGGGFGSSAIFATGASLTNSGIDASNETTVGYGIEESNGRAFRNDGALLYPVSFESYALEATAIDLENVPMAVTLQNLVPGDRNWHNVLNDCARFGTDAAGYIVESGVSEQSEGLRFSAGYMLDPNIKAALAADQAASIAQLSAAFATLNQDFDISIGEDLALRIAADAEGALQASYIDTRDDSVLGTTRVEATTVTSKFSGVEIPQSQSFSIGVPNGLSLSFSGLGIELGDYLQVSLVTKPSSDNDDAVFNRLQSAWQTLIDNQLQTNDNIRNNYPADSIYRVLIKEPVRDILGPAQSIYADVVDNNADLMVFVELTRNTIEERLWVNETTRNQLRMAIDDNALANPEQDSTNSINCNHPTFPDRDGDLIPDDRDAFPDDKNESVDTDGDGSGDNSDAFPEDANESIDSDGDGVGNNADDDDDGDGVSDVMDALPLNPDETEDSDADGIGNNEDDDDDNDGVADVSDAFPEDPNESRDSDGDGVGDNADQLPDNADEQLDADGDGIGNNADNDDDNDGEPDSSDAFPFDATEQSDLDSDGIGDNSDPDRDGDSVWNDSDAFPNDPNESVDSDGDGTGDNSDPDRDGDGVANEQDAFPNDPNEQNDLDNDGTGDNADSDRDGDGLANAEDSHPDDPNLPSQGNGNANDTDGDGVPNDQDAFPNDPNESVDSDGDGVGDNGDAFPNNLNESIDSDGDGCGDNSDFDPNDADIPGPDACENGEPSLGGFPA